MRFNYDEVAKGIETLSGSGQTHTRIGPDWSWPMSSEAFADIGYNLKELRVSDTVPEVKSSG